VATYTENYNFTKVDLADSPPDITAINANWDTVDAKLKELSEGSTDEVIKTYTITPEMWVGSAFPYTCPVTHGLGGEPASKPFVDVDLSSYTVLEDVEEVESAYCNLYRVTFDATRMVLYSKEIPEVSYTLIVKVVM
jgi:hypothetical protein